MMRILAGTCLVNLKYKQWILKWKLWYAVTVMHRANEWVVRAWRWRIISRCRTRLTPSITTGNHPGNCESDAHWTALLATRLSITTASSRLMLCFVGCFLYRHLGAERRIWRHFATSDYYYYASRTVRPRCCRRSLTWSWWPADDFCRRSSLWTLLAPSDFSDESRSPWQPRHLSILNC